MFRAPCRFWVEPATWWHWQGCGKGQGVAEGRQGEQWRGILPDNDLIQGFGPFVPADPQILILGSMPSVESLRQGFYYMHQSNRFYKILESIAGFHTGADIKSRQRLLQYLHIALFDVIGRCSRRGSLDSNVRDITPNNIGALLHSCPEIRVVITNGSLAKKIFLKYTTGCGLRVCHLPSTSSANAGFSLEKLISLYAPVIKNALS